jgi:hypothetical protein
MWRPFCGANIIDPPILDRARRCNRISIITKPFRDDEADLGLSATVFAEELKMIRIVLIAIAAVAVLTVVGASAGVVINSLITGGDKCERGELSIRCELDW